jgi:hypothetical protein
LGYRNRTQAYYISIARTKNQLLLLLLLLSSSLLLVSLASLLSSFLSSSFISLNTRKIPWNFEILFYKTSNISINTKLKLQKNYIF